MYKGPIIRQKDTFLGIQYDYIFTYIVGGKK